MGQQNPNHQLKDGKHPIIYRVSSILLVEVGFKYPVNDVLYILQRSGVKYAAVIQPRRRDHGLYGSCGSAERESPFNGKIGVISVFHHTTVKI
jgi:hypothetical protein